ncbi:MAG TPA: hypothetical protein VLJ39_05570, partial [Tepidisphaeraceae bacterium]|nr:hypothetical protein [Tepidisphaeraceae bacterium]
LDLDYTIRIETPDEERIARFRRKGDHQRASVRRDDRGTEESSRIRRRRSQRKIQADWARPSRSFQRMMAKPGGPSRRDRGSRRPQKGASGWECSVCCLNRSPFELWLFSGNRDGRPSGRKVLRLRVLRFRLEFPGSFGLIGRSGQTDGRDEAVSDAGNGFDVAGRVCRVTESVAKFLDALVQSVIEVDEDVGRPEALTELFTGDDVSGGFEQDRQEAKGLLRQPDDPTISGELRGRRVKLEQAKANGPPGRRNCHSSPQHEPKQFSTRWKQSGRARRALRPGENLR